MSNNNNVTSPIDPMLTPEGINGSDSSGCYGGAGYPGPFGGTYNPTPTISTDAVNNIVKHKLKWVIKINSLPDKELIKLIFEDSEIYEFIIEPSEDVTNAYLLKEKL